MIFGVLPVHPFTVYSVRWMGILYRRDFYGIAAELGTI